jgi:transketolase
MVKTALELAAMGIGADAWSAPYIKPFDPKHLIAMSRGYKLIVTLEEHSVIGGLGSAVAEALSSVGGPVVHRIGVRDRFSRFCGTWSYLLEEHGLDLDSVAKEIRELSASS